MFKGPPTAPLRWDGEQLALGDTPAKKGEDPLFLQSLLPSTFCSIPNLKKVEREEAKPLLWRPRAASLSWPSWGSAQGRSSTANGCSWGDY